MPSTYYLKDFFADAAFKQDLVVRGKKSSFLATMSASAAAEIDEREKQASVDEVEGCGRVLADAKRELKAANMAKARTAMTKKQADRVTKRTFKLRVVT